MPALVSNTFLKPSIFQSFPEVVAAQSTRLGGFSLPPYESLNLGLYTNDDPGAIQKNRSLFFEQLGFSESHSAGAHQVHGRKVLVVKEPGQYEGYDALVTDRKDILLTVTTADCTPILVYDPKQQVCAAVHAGWRGTIAQIVSKTLQTMQTHFAARPENCTAYIGPCIDHCTYEVDADVADYFENEFKQWDETKGKFFIDMKKANLAQLLEAGLSSKNIEVSPYSTFSNNDTFFSYRKEKGKTGRMLSVIGRKG